MLVDFRSHSVDFRSVLSADAKSVALAATHDANASYRKPARQQNSDIRSQSGILRRENGKNTPKTGFGASAILTYVVNSCSSAVF